MVARSADCKSCSLSPSLVRVNGMSVELFSEYIGLCCCFLFPLTEVKSSSSIFVSGEAECWIAVGCEGWGRTALPAYSPSHEM